MLGGDRRLRRAGRLARNGRQANGVIVGVARALDGDATSDVLAIQVADGPRAGVEPLVAPIGRLRLGMPVIVRHDAERAVLDWPVMCATWGLDPGSPAFRHRPAPDDGVDDRARDARMLLRLARWTPARATLVALERRLVFGLPTPTWKLTLAVAGGGSAECADEVPFYARWLAAPGVELPVAVKPEDATKVVVDWARAAVEAAPRAGGVADAPPPGSVAERDERG